MEINIDTYLCGDQPTCCPSCGTRTLWLGDFSHTNAKYLIHECLTKVHQYIFIVQEEKLGNDLTEIFYS
jgi:hypothetical protein